MFVWLFVIKELREIRYLHIDLTIWSFVEIRVVIAVSSSGRASRAIKIHLGYEQQEPLFNLIYIIMYNFIPLF